MFVSAVSFSNTDSNTGLISQDINSAALNLPAVASLEQKQAVRAHVVSGISP